MNSNEQHSNKNNNSNKNSNVRTATFSKHFNNCSLCWKTLDSSKGTSYHLSFKQEALCWSQFIWPIFNETKH